MRLDHLLSKELLFEPFGSDTPVDHWLIAVMGIHGPLSTARLRTSRRRAGERACDTGRHYSVLRERLAVRRAAQYCTGLTSHRCRRGPSGPPATRRPLSVVYFDKRTFRAHLENSIASTSIYVLQVTKSQRRMPWRLKPKKDVGGCDKPRGVAYQAWIRGCPNGETRHPSWGATLV